MYQKRKGIFSVISGWAGTGILMAISAIFLIGCGNFFGGGSGGGGGGGATATTCTATQTSDAATLVSAAKTALEAQLASAAATPFGDSIDDSAAKFELAYTTCPGNQEALFYSAISHLPLFLDDNTTTTFLGKLGLQSYRIEAELSSGFDASPLIVGGTESNVNISVAELLAYGGEDLAGSLEEAATLLSGISTSFTSSLIVRNNGVDETWVFDYTDAKVIEATLHMMRIPLIYQDIWNFTGIDQFISDKSTRDDSTGDFLDELTESEREDFFVSGNDGVAGNTDDPFTVNQTGVEQLALAAAKTFALLGDSLSNLLAESDVQTDDVIVTTGDTPEYDDQEEVNRFVFSLAEQMANSIGDSFNSTTAVTVNNYIPVASISSWDTCTPVSGGTVNSSVMANSGSFSVTVANLTEVVTVPSTSFDSSSGISPGSRDPADSRYYFKFDLSSARNISIFTRGASSNANSTSGQLGYSADGSAITHWDQDSDSGGEGHFGISIADDYFDGANLPDTFPVTFYLAVTAANVDFMLYIWSDDSSTSEPIFLQGGGGRNFTTKVYQKTGRVSLRNFVQAAGDFWDNSDRSSLILADGVTTSNNTLEFDTATMKSEILTIFPDATVNITDQTGVEVYPDVNIFRDEINVDGAGWESGEDVTSQFSSAPLFCAYPWQLDLSPEYEGGFELY